VFEFRWTSGKEKNKTRTWPSWLKNPNSQFNTAPILLKFDAPRPTVGTHPHTKMYPNSHSSSRENGSRTMTKTTSWRFDVGIYNEVFSCRSLLLSSLSWNPPAKTNLLGCLVGIENRRKHRWGDFTLVARLGVVPCSGVYLELWRINWIELNWVELRYVFSLGSLLLSPLLWTEKVTQNIARLLGKKLGDGGRRQNIYIFLNDEGTLPLWQGLVKSM